MQKEQIIYGVYNNANKGLVTRLQDFFIDHSGVTLKEKSYFFHMLAVMVDAGVPLVQTLKSLAARSRSDRFQRILNTVAYAVEHGESLSAAMRRFTVVFNETEVGVVESGEATGRLSAMLFKLSGQLDKKHDLHLKLWGAAIYPLAVLVVLILVATGMLVWVFPNLVKLLEEGGVAKDSLPLATRFLMAAEWVVTGYWWAILAGILLLYGIFLAYVKSDSGAVSWDGAKLRMPIVGSIMRKYYVYNFVSLLGILIEAGLPVIKSLKITADALSNRVYKLKINAVIDDVTRGVKISDGLRESEYLFPGEVVEMLAVGEASASLAKISEKVAEQYQREIDNTLKKASSIFEPLMIVIVGLMTALLAMAVMSPIFDLTAAVNV
ncbi:type II secretion system F family protein [Candidatus Peregrinibacteria bacterium]|nr:type II secretion system F family protein [Candidatus Peregrinibacteria bacterium]